MPLILAKFDFEGDAPTAEAIRERAESLGSLPLDAESTGFGAQQISFACIDGAVNLRIGRSVVRLRSHASEAPILLSLLSHTLIEMGGKDSYESRPEMDLPLTEEAVIEETKAIRRSWQRIGIALTVMWIALAVGVLVALGWLVRLIWRWLT